MENRCTFAVATSQTGPCWFSDNISVLDNPMGTVSCLTARAVVVSLPPHRAFLFLHLKATPHANSHHTTATAPRRARRSTARRSKRLSGDQSDPFKGSTPGEILPSGNLFSGIQGKVPQLSGKGKSLTASTRDINHAPAVLRGGRGLKYIALWVRIKFCQNCFV